MSLNKVILIGNVGKDPDVRYFDSGAAVANFPLATSERGHNIVVRRDLVPFVEKWVRKGSGVYVEGKIRTRNYDDQSGVKRYVTEIHADRIEFYSTGSRPADGGNTTAQGGSMQPNVGQGQPAQPTTAPNTAYQQPAASQPSAFSESSDADDLPF